MTGLLTAEIVAPSSSGMIIAASVVMTGLLTAEIVAPPITIPTPLAVNVAAATSTLLASPSSALALSFTSSTCAGVSGTSTVQSVRPGHRAATRSSLTASMSRFSLKKERVTAKEATVTVLQLAPGGRGGYGGGGGGGEGGGSTNGCSPQPKRALVPKSFSWKTMLR